MKNVILVMSLLIASAVFYTKAQAGNSITTMPAFDRDPFDILQPGESLVANGEVIKNTSELKIKVAYCPGSGEKCKVSVEIKGVKVSYEEEKGEDEPPVKVTMTY